MGSLFEELDAREAASRARVEELRQRMAELTQAIEHEEAVLSRVAITREMVTEILGPAPAGEPGDQQAEADAAPAATAPSGSPIGVLTVHPWQEGVAATVLPHAYQDILEVFVDHGGGMPRAGQVGAAVGLGRDKSRIEGLRSKLNKLAARGWLELKGPGMFVLPAAVADSVQRGAGKPGR